jgi:hypothetical protein
MKQSQIIRLCKSPFFLFVCVTLLLFATSQVVYGQEPPPRPMIVTVNLSQNLSFGAFYQGATGGSVIIFPNGSRSSTGDVVLLNMGYSFSTGLYDIVANAGTLVAILNGPDAILSGSNGGSLTLKIGTSSPATPFIVTTSPPSSTQLRIGGTLLVGTPLANPPGNFSGTFNVTFVQE